MISLTILLRARMCYNRLTTLQCRRFVGTDPNQHLGMKETIDPASDESFQPKQLIFGRKLPNITNLPSTDVLEKRQAWVENLENGDSLDKRGLVDLHPEIFGTFPRFDLIHRNVEWQRKYKKINWIEMLHRVEMWHKGPRPWPLKGTGRARHKDKRSPIWIGGGWAHPPKLRTWYYMLEFTTRVRGLQSTLACKLAQNDLVIVDTLDNFPSDDPKELESFIEERGWGPSVLICDLTEVFPTNIALAAEGVDHINLVPVYGLNVEMMMKHETLILTLAALEEIENKLTYHLRRTDLRKANSPFKPLPAAGEMDPHVYPLPE